MYIYNALLSRVVDGDTIDVVIDIGFKLTTKQRIRLAHINTPEIFRTKTDSPSYKKGIQAKQYVEKRLLDNDNKMKIETFKTPGKYGRYIGVVILEDSDLSLNQELVQKGYATNEKS